MDEGFALTRFVLRRTFWAFFLFIVATFVTYVIFYVVPANPVSLINGAGGTTAGQHLRTTLHLDVPVFQQYWIFVWNIVRHGSLGYSFLDGSSVRSVLGREAPITGSLILGGAVLWLLLAIPIGIISAIRPRSLVDRFGMIFVLIGVSAPAVWLGLILAYSFGFKLGWTPIADYCNFFPTHGLTLCSGPARWAYHLVLPWTTFALLFAAIYTRMIRASVMETLSEDYVRTAKAKGAGSMRLLVHHVLRNSMLPVVTLLGLDLVALGITNAVWTETVFNLHGLGSEIGYAARVGNLPMAVGIVVVVTIAVIVLNFIVDVLYAFLDPRIRLST